MGVVLHTGIARRPLTDNFFRVGRKDLCPYSALVGTAMATQGAETFLGYHANNIIIRYN